MGSPPPRSRLGALGLILSLLGCGPRGCLGTLVGLGVVLVVGAGALGLLQAVFAPWSVPLPGRPTLVGDWVGTLRTGSGMPIGIALHIDYRGGSDGAGRSRIDQEGRAQLCNRGGERYDYTLTGATRDWGGATSLIGFASTDRTARGSGWSALALWDGDRLTLSGSDAPFLLDERPPFGRPVLAVVDPVVGDLHHASFGDLDRLCASLGQQGGPR